MWERACEWACEQSSHQLPIQRMANMWTSFRMSLWQSSHQVPMGRMGNVGVSLWMSLWMIEPSRPLEKNGKCESELVNEPVNGRAIKSLCEERRTCERACERSCEWSPFQERSCMGGHTSQSTYDKSCRMAIVKAILWTSLWTKELCFSRTHIQRNGEIG